MICNNRSCTNDILPENSTYFKEEMMEGILKIPPQKPDIESVSDLLVTLEILNTKLIETKIGRSNEGQNLTGIKLIAEIKIKEKITYISCSQSESVHAAHFESYRSMFIILPQVINEKNICDLIRSQKFSITPYVENKQFRKLDCRNIYRCLMILLDVKIC